MSRAPGDSKRVARIVWLFKAGRDRAAIAVEVGCTVALINSTVHRLGLTPRRPDLSARNADICRRRLAGETTWGIATAHAITPGAVAAVLKRAGLTHPSRSRIGRRCDAWREAA